jgi:hypothetical protein
MKASATASIHGVMREEENRAITRLTSTIKTKDRYGQMAKRSMKVEQLFASILTAPQRIFAANCVSTMRLQFHYCFPSFQIPYKLKTKLLSQCSYYPLSCLGAFCSTWFVDHSKYWKLFGSWYTDKRNKSGAMLPNNIEDLILI